MAKNIYKNIMWSQSHTQTHTQPPINRFGVQFFKQTNIVCKTFQVDIDVGLSKLYFQMDEPIVKLFRERKYPLHFDISVQAAFSRLNCQKGGNGGGSGNGGGGHGGGGGGHHKHGNAKRYNRNRQYGDKGKGNMCVTLFDTILVRLARSFVFEI